MLSPEVNYQELMTNTVMAVQALYSQSQMERKHEASVWLENLQQSVHAWKVADQLLHQKMDLNTCYFGAHTLRTKIQNSFHELPEEAHFSLRDSLLSHVAAVTMETDQIIVTQLCVAVADLVLHMSNWADPIGHLLNVFEGDSKHWWPLLEIFRVLPEEVYSRKLKLGDNRRNQLVSSLETASPRVYTFLRRCLAACLSGTVDARVCPVELCGIELVKCFGSWVALNPECFCLTAASDADILTFAFMQLREGKCHWKMHTAATDCLCAVIEVLPNLESNNNNTVNLQNFQLQLLALINSLEEAYHYSVAEEDIEKTLNYCRIFTEYAESMVPYMLRSWRDPHYSIRVIDLVLLCAGHHDYEVAETTYGFWYQLSEDLYHAHDESLNAVFRPYVYRLIHCLYKHCKIEPDHEGPLNTSDDFYDFRKKTAELFSDIIFVVGYSETFNALAESLRNAQSWEDQEAALFLMYCTRKEMRTAGRDQVWPVIERILNWTDWQHVCLKTAAFRLIGGFAEWIAANSGLALEKTIQILVQELPHPQTNSYAAAAFQTVCEGCAEEIAERHLSYILTVVNQLDQYDVTTEAATGLFRGVGHVLSAVSADKLAHVVRPLCRAQLEPLNKLLETQSPNDRSYAKNSKNDPVYWLNRLSGFFRCLSIPKKAYQGFQHPCKEAVCEDFWPVISRYFDIHQADVRLMEQCCRCVRFAVRCIGKEASSFLSPLVEQLVNVYSKHLHSCCLYLASILVDEFGSEPECIEGLLRTLEFFITPTFNVFSQPQGLRNHPDTVDDFFRLCTRYIQRCPIPFLKSSMVDPIMQCAMQASTIDHREANMGVMKFLYDIVHCGRKREPPYGEECSVIVKNILQVHASNLISTILHAAVFDLPTYTFTEICEFFHELKEFMVDDFPSWFEVALKKLPNKTVSGKEATTVQQLQDFHKRVTLSRSPKELSKSLKDFTRLYR